MCVCVESIWHYNRIQRRKKNNINPVVVINKYYIMTLCTCTLSRLTLQSFIICSQSTTDTKTDCVYQQSYLGTLGLVKVYDPVLYLEHSTHGPGWDRNRNVTMRSLNKATFYTKPKKSIQPLLHSVWVSCWSSFSAVRVLLVRCAFQTPGAQQLNLVCSKTSRRGSDHVGGGPLV